MVIKVLIVDDEPLARKGVALRLRAYPDIEVVGMCSDGKQAIQRIPELAPDLVFLDIQMPLIGGIEVLRALPQDTLPVIIFLTAFDEHALAAFEVQALDYLLKPIDEVRFISAVERARRLIKLKHQSALYDLTPMPQAPGEESSPAPLKRFAVRKGKELAFVDSADIDWIEAAGDYVQLHAKDKTYLIRESLSTLETLLDHDDFLRIHRSAIIRLDRIIRIAALANRDGWVTLRGGPSLRVSRSYSKQLKNRLRNRRPAETHGPESGR